MAGSRLIAGATPILLALALSACGSSGSGSTGGANSAADSGTGSLQFAVFNPFSGPDASFGPEQYAGCAPAAAAISAAGGVLDHKTVSCKVADSRGDPADAVPAAAQLIASDKSLVGVLGPSSDEAAATVPLFARSKIPMFADTGQALFNKSTYNYFWRITPPDDAVGYAMAVYAHAQGYKRVAAVFGNDISSQGTAPTVEAGFRRLGGTITTAQNVALGQSSYRTEVTAMAAQHPDALFIEADPQTSATYLSEVAQLYHLIPIIGTDGTTQPPWQKAVVGALGHSAVQRFYTGAQPFAPTSGPAHTLWVNQLHQASSSVAKPLSQWVNDSFAEAAWDSLNVMALAMEMAKSTQPGTYNAFIRKVTTPAPGATAVHDFAAGKAAIRAHKRMFYVGAAGPIAFDRYNNSSGGFEIVRSDGAVAKKYTADDVRAAE